MRELNRLEEIYLVCVDARGGGDGTSEEGERQVEEQRDER
jgi:hypothetical protein